MSQQPKSITFVSWKKHKVDQALTQVNEVYNNYVDAITFETIIDFFRQFAFPGTLPVREINENLPIVPKSPYDITLDPGGIVRKQICPICNQEVDSPRFTYHLASKCFPECKDKVELIAKYFDSQKAEDS